MKTVKNSCIFLFLLALTSCFQPVKLVEPPTTSTSSKSRRPQLGPVLSNSSKSLKAPYVLLISIDGYRYDYTKKFSPPHLNKFIKKGIQANGLIPIFPSTTFPNHYSIVTGLRAENHGIVNNTFWSATHQKVYKISDRKVISQGHWYLGEPLWVAAAKAQMVSASYFWVGSEASIQGIHPSYWYNYTPKASPKEKVRQVLKWFQMPALKRPHFVTLYFPEVDKAGHIFGPDSPQTKSSVLSVDQALGQLFEGLKKLEIDVNVIITSDHGMETTSPDKAFHLSDHIDLNHESIRVEGRGTHALVYISDPSIKKDVYRRLKKIPRLTVYKREELSSKYGYSQSDRVGDFILSVHSPYYMHFNKNSKEKARPPSPGQHGYDPFIYKNMQGIFYAQGPHILNKGEIPTIEIIDIYPFIMKLLDLEIKTPIDGNPKALSPYIKTR